VELPQRIGISDFFRRDTFKNLTITYRKKNLKKTQENPTPYQKDIQLAESPYRTIAFVERLPEKMKN